MKNLNLIGGVALFAAALFSGCSDSKVQRDDTKRLETKALLEKCILKAAGTDKVITNEEKADLIRTLGYSKAFERETPNISQEVDWDRPSGVNFMIYHNLINWESFYVSQEKLRNYLENKTESRR